MRIVSLCPSLTELVFDLGRGDELVGITKFCVHPRDKVIAIAKVGGTKNPKIRAIAELAPDIVLMNEEENRAEDADALVALGMRCHTSMPRTVLETAEMVRSIGAALDARASAERIARDIEERSARVHESARWARVVPYAYLIWREPWMAVGADTFASSLLAQAGGHNAFGARAERYPEIGIGELRAADPELVLLCTEPFPFEERHADELAQATGLPRARFRIADGEYLSWHGSRTPAGIDYAAGLIERARGDSPTTSTTHRRERS